MTATATKKSNWQGLGLRVAAAVFLIPFVLFITWSGPVYFALMLAVIGIIMAREWTMIVFGGNNLQWFLHSLAALIACIGPFVIPSGFLLIAIILFLWAVAAILAAKSANTRFWQLIGVVYVAFPLLALVMLRASTPLGLQSILLLFAAIWSADTMAYFFGRFLGGPKLWPAVSPNKTWAGMLGAAVGAAIGSMLIFWSFSLSSILIAAVLGAVLGVVEQGGDLFESAAKRAFSVKDSGNIIPGHGGILDRVDGLVAAALVALLIGFIRAGHSDVATGLLNW